MKPFQNLAFKKEKKKRVSVTAKQIWKRNIQLKLTF